MRVFLSCASDDAEIARDLAGRLVRAGLDVFFAADELMPGENIALKIGQALERADAMVVLISPAAARSDSVRQEIGFAIGSPRYKDRIIPVVVRATGEMPWMMQAFQSIRAGKDRGRLGRTVISRLARHRASDN